MWRRAQGANLFSEDIEKGLSVGSAGILYTEYVLMLAYDCFATVSDEDK